MKERPIIFDAESVRGILAGAKTQTRRVVTPQPEPASDVCYLVDKMFFPNIKDELEMAYARIQFPDNIADVIETSERCPYGYQGDRLWVREVWGSSHTQYLSKLHCWHYADGEPPFATGPAWRKRSPIHMPRWASRLLLEVATVWVERLQQISDVDIEAEMAWAALGDSAPANFADRWDAINAKRGWPWASNPWVWVVEFRVLWVDTP